MNRIRYILSLHFTLLMVVLSFSQEIPPVINYTPVQYHAGNQNWQIDQDENGWMYIANNDGLLRFNGAQWDLFASPNNSIMRSVKVIDTKIYTGCYMEFGYWETAKDGSLNYTSVSDKFKDQIIEDEQFWNITSQGDYILFQSLDRILVYNAKTEALDVIPEENGITRMFTADKEVFFHSSGAGLFRLEKGEPAPFIDHEIIKNSKVVQLIEEQHSFLIITQQNGVYRSQANGDLERIPLPASLASSAIYSAGRLQSGNIALGTISHGTYITNNNFETVLHLNQATGLSNNTVLAVFEDRKGNLWTAMDNGLNCINLHSPFNKYFETNGKLGTVYASAKVDDLLYLGTNQGLFYKNATDPSFQLVEGTRSQVWSLFYYDNTLFCGHDSGTFIIEKDQATRISEIPGTWDFRTIPGKPNRIIQGNYNGFNLLEKTNGRWKFQNPISGFNYSSKHFELTDDLKIYMSHEYKGVFELQLNAALTAIESFRKLEQPEKGKNAGLAKFGKEILFTSPSGIYKLNPTNDTSFQKDALLTSLISGSKYISGKMVQDKHEDLWLFTKDNLIQLKQGAISKTPQINMVPIPYNQIRAKGGYEHIASVGNDQYIIGSTDGYLKLNLRTFRENEYQIQMGAVWHSNREQTQPTPMSLLHPEPVHNDNNTVYFSYTIPEYQRYTRVKYQYKLTGLNQDWSPWSTASSVSFENLPHGKYTFSVRGKIGNQLTKNTAVYNFEILPPWYFSSYALACYAFLLILLAFFINQQYKRYYQRKQKRVLAQTEEKYRLEQLEKEQELVKLRNEKLQQDVSSKNRELAASTMNIIKKNEFLIEIRDQLKNLNGNSDKDIKKLITNINKDINEEDNWNLFKDAFNNADKDFLKKVKDLHPNLTPNDLRLCAYLRLNLSSKEIAPLLNISVRSVEIKRYRLRKKMELAHEKGLVEYILSV